MDGIEEKDIWLVTASFFYQSVQGIMEKKKYFRIDTIEDVSCEENGNFGRSI